MGAAAPRADAVRRLLIQWFRTPHPMLRSLMISIRSLSFRYPGSTFRLEVPELEIAAGSTAAIVGPSGSGKTTLLNLICGILTPTAVEVTTCEMQLSFASESARRKFRVRQVGLVFQEFELLEHLSVRDNILLPCRLTSAIQLDSALQARADQLAKEMGMADKRTRYPRQLSQGERQRVALCRALLLEPPLLLCDEPTGNLDPANMEHVLDILFAYVRRNGTTLLAVTHDHDLLPRFDETVDLRSSLHRSEQAS